LVHVENFWSHYANVVTKRDKPKNQNRYLTSYRLVQADCAVIHKHVYSPCFDLWWRIRTWRIVNSSLKTNSATGFIKAIESGSKHLIIKRFTLRYPEKKLKFVGDGYQYDPKRGVGIAGYRGRHILFHDKCTGCQLCAIACEGIAEAIGMVKVDEQWKHNKKAIMPQIDFGKCVFCGLCVDACPFYALFMTDDYELSSFTKEHLIYTPAQLAIKPKYQGTVEIKIDDMGATHG